MKADYTFLSWAREGLANRITAPDPNPAAQTRAEIDVALTLTSHGLDGSDTPHPVSRAVQLYGPGDILGLDARTVVRTEPRDWITNFEPNYVAAIEFYDETLPWRYTPAAPDAAGVRLRPWMMLIVLAEDEFGETSDAQTRPLPVITLTDDALANAMPDPDTLWAWAHIHVNRGITASDTEIVAADRDAVAARLDAAVRGDADIAYSRIVSPRRLLANKTYHAFVLPVFESGRLAGLGLDPGAAPNATASAWKSNGQDKNVFPVYYRWQFRTGALGDFEALVRLLQPRPVDRRVGVRDMDVQRPGANLPGIDDARLHGVLQLGGALRVPRSSLSQEEHDAVLAQENWAQPTPHPFQSKLAALINLADDYQHSSAAQANAVPDVSGITQDPDPLITPPLYGRWHALTQRLLKERTGQSVPNPQNWVHELNLDPRFRVPAGFGTRVVQDKQEDLMAAAWEQVGDVLEANQRLRRLKFSQRAAFVWHKTHLGAISANDPAQAIALTEPVQARVIAGGVTMRSVIAASAVPPALLAPTMRRMTRSGAHLMRALPFSESIRRQDLILRVNSGQVLAAPPKFVPPGVVTVDQVVDAALPSMLPGWLAGLLRNSPWAVALPLIVAIVLVVLLWFLGFPLVAMVLVVVGAAAAYALYRALRTLRATDSLKEFGQTPASVDALPASPDFTLAVPGTTVNPVTLQEGGTDSAEGARFKTALKDLNRLLRASTDADTVGENGPARPRLDLPRVARQTLAAIDPALTIPRLARAQIRVPPRIRAERPEEFVEAMAYPVFDLPMYAPLRDISAELLIPNVNFIGNNTITLLETNQKFIEAYMVGLNHEFARELLWREYPTDQRGSCFRQFWDVSSFLSAAGADDATLREKLRDIPPLHLWSRASKLGDHDARERTGDNEEEVVLVIRGELLKRYPTAVIYAQAADWARKPNGDIDRAKERSLVELTAAEEADPPREKLRTPLYQAKIEPDIYFFGFDLTVAAARGGSGENQGDPAGWFFVIKERPGEPRFGFDETSDPQIVVYNDLGWDRVPMNGQFIQPLGANPPTIPASSPADQAEKEEQRAEDQNVRWDGGVSAAELAYIMYQAPVMVAVHAAEALPAG
ncbi:hypothetical protein G5V57_20830 [Nordella sp. HKS 07]|uniref:hypothetical protein n=1 Tax=Nordella sp. HKS 07 TaxID=2712222 RepID=UPI0013E19495|nr:hypothetical protein [Nordella sp. HKS 07]QIG49954.1 hypothetical protein G5V57_20830 [Nordella sp. HKS 07]